MRTVWRAAAAGHRGTAAPALAIMAAGRNAPAAAGRAAAAAMRVLAEAAVRIIAVRSIFVIVVVVGFCIIGGGFSFFFSLSSVSVLVRAGG